VLTLFHDYASPASAVAVARFRRLAAEGLPVELAGFDAIGIDLALPVTLDVKAALADLGEVARAEGIVLREPPALPPTALAHVVGEAAEAAGCGAAWHEAAYAGLWRDGRDLAAPAVLLELAEVAGLDRSVAEAAVADRARLAAFRRRSAGHRSDGVGGVPTILAQRTLVPGLLDEADLRVLAVLG
jgi:predicted DsbA family dithiol-disulfide isomerase